MLTGNAIAEQTERRNTSHINETRDFREGNDVFEQPVIDSASTTATTISIRMERTVHL